MRALGIVVAASLAAAPLDARADDADLIPSGVLSQAPKVPAAVDVAPSAPRPRSKLSWKLFLEDALTVSDYDHATTVPYPSSLAVGWQNRASFDVYLRYTPVRQVALTLSDRLNLYVQDQQAFLSRDTVRNDLREAYATWEPDTGIYVEAGRINVRHGAALGYNPSDVFKTRTLVGQASLDPSVIRQNRLGALMVRGQAIWNGGSGSVAFAPKLMSPAPVVQSDPVGVDPHFGATNGAYRALATLAFDVLSVNPEIIAYLEQGRSKVGVNLTRSIGDAIVVYAEWAGGPEQDLIARAVAFGRKSGTLPERAPSLLPTDSGTFFRTDLSTGFSWTIATKATLNVEYHLHSSGFGLSDWRSWFKLATAKGSPAALVNELWYLRAYANDQQEPLTQHEAFVRASWPRAFVPDLDLSAFAFVDLLDGSVLGQAAATYYPSSRWTTSVYLSTNLGTPRSERGSFPLRVSSIFQLTFYL